MALQDIFLLSAFSGCSLCDPADLPAMLSQSELYYVDGRPKFRLGPSINALLDPVLMLIGVAVAGISWGVCRHKREEREAVLESAWREVLADPHYFERRELEERRLLANDHHEATR